MMNSPGGVYEGCLVTLKLRIKPSVMGAILGEQQHPVRTEAAVDP
jgi:hypothetical protein